jgi:hypothetical protein
MAVDKSGGKPRCEDADCSCRECGGRKRRDRDEKGQRDG